MRGCQNHRITQKTQGRGELSRLLYNGQIIPTPCSRSDEWHFERSVSSQSLQPFGGISWGTCWSPSHPWLLDIQFLKPFLYPFLDWSHVSKLLALFKWKWQRESFGGSNSSFRSKFNSFWYKWDNLAHLSTRKDLLRDIFLRINVRILTLLLKCYPSRWQAQGRIELGG